MNGHNLIFTNPAVQVLIGGKKLVGQIPCNVYHEGHTERVCKEKHYHDDQGKWHVEKEYYDAWIPGYYTTEYKDQYEYENLNIKIKNGTVKGCSGSKVPDKKPVYWLSKAHGENGSTPDTMFYIISGLMCFENTKVIAGNGSDGGNATYSAVWHVPFVGGENGGNGGNLFFVEQGAEKSIVAVDKKSKLIPGNGGKGGRGGEPNPNYWVFSGKRGKNGKDGAMGEIINDKSKLLEM